MQHASSIKTFARFVFFFLFSWLLFQFSVWMWFKEPKFSCPLFFNLFINTRDYLVPVMFLVYKIRVHLNSNVYCFIRLFSAACVHTNKCTTVRILLATETTVQPSHTMRISEQTKQILSVAHKYIPYVSNANETQYISFQTNPIFN